ncbi:MAG TPA: S8 family serine peptidase, partial [Gammaproteobacteria bacterium]
ADQAGIEVTFRIRLINEKNNNPEYVSLQQNSPAQTYQLNDAGKNGDAIAGDAIYSSTISLNTLQKVGTCFKYRAYAVISKRTIESPDYRLCVTSFPVDIAASNTRPDNLLTIDTDASPAVADELLVRFTPKATEQDIANAAVAVQAKITGTILPRRLYQFQFPQALSLQQLTTHITSLRNNPAVDHAYPNWVGSYAALPNDPEYILNNQHGYQLINADDAWDLGAEGAGITIAVVDTGVDTHPDLPIGGQPDVPNHGTAMAGVVGALTDNAVGVAGIAGNSTLESVVVSPDSAITMTEMVMGLQTVASDPSPPDVVTAGFNVTLAPVLVDTASLDHFDLCRAINDIVLDGGVPVAVVVSAAGNNNSNGNHYPSRCNDNTATAHSELADKSLLITVLGSISCTGVCATDTRQVDSNYGPWIDVAAPAENIRSTNNAGGYGYFSGTSFAAALVAGSAAQMMSCGATPAQIQSRLTSTAPVTVPFPGGGAPRIDAYAAVLAGNTAPTGISLGGSGSINENTDTAAGFTVGTLSAVDANTCDTHSFNIQGGVDAGVFSIGGADLNELVITAGVLDFETKPSYSVTVRVTDAGGITFDQPVVITVSDVVENTAPVVNNQTFSIGENSANGSAVGTVAANDAEGDSLNFSITAGNTGGAFAINASSGAITVANTAALDFETTPSFALTVDVSDGVLSDTATVTVNLTNANEVPVVNNQTFTINENLPNG